MSFFDSAAPEVLDIVFDNLRSVSSPGNGYFLGDYEDEPEFFTNAARLDIQSTAVSRRYHSDIQSSMHKTAMAGFYNPDENAHVNGRGEFLVSTNIPTIVEHGNVHKARYLELRINPCISASKLLEKLVEKKFLGRVWPNITSLRIYGINTGNTDGPGEGVSVARVGADANEQVLDSDDRLPGALNYRLTELNDELCKALPNLKKVIYYYRGDGAYGEPLIEVLLHSMVGSLVSIDIIDTDFFFVRLGDLPKTVQNVTVNVGMHGDREVGFDDQYLRPIRIFAPTIKSLRLNNVDPGALWEHFHAWNDHQSLAFNELESLYLKFEDDAGNYQVAAPKNARFGALRKLGVENFLGDINDFLSYFPLYQISELVVHDHPGWVQLDLTPLANLDSLKVVFNHLLLSDLSTSPYWTHPLLTSNSRIKTLEVSYYLNSYTSARLTVPDDVQLNQLQCLRLYVQCGRGQLVKLLGQLPRLKQLFTTYEMLEDSLLDTGHPDLRIPSEYVPISMSLVYFNLQDGLPQGVSPQKLHALAMFLARMPNLKRLVIPTSSSGPLRAKLNAILDSGLSSEVQHLEHLLGQLQASE